MSCIVVFGFVAVFVMSRPPYSKYAWTAVGRDARVMKALASQCCCPRHAPKDAAAGAGDNEEWATSLSS